MGGRMKMRTLFIMPTIVLVVIFSLLCGCLNQEGPIINSGNEGVPDSIPLSPSPATEYHPVENKSNRSENPAASCNFTGLEGGIKTTRTEVIIRGKGSITEENITYAVEEFALDLKIPGYVPDDFFFRYVIIPDQYSEGKVTLTFVNKSYEGYYSSGSASNQMYIAFSRNLDVEFIEFIGQEPEPVCINGTPGFYYTSPERNKLRWIDGDVERWVVGSFDADTLIRIADSLRPPSALDLTSDIYSGNKIWIPGTFPPGVTVPGTPGK